MKLIVAASAAVLLASTPALAHHNRHHARAYTHHIHTRHQVAQSEQQPWGWQPWAWTQNETTTASYTPEVRQPIYGSDPRPKAWCGYFLRPLLGVADRSYNLAIHWLNYGHAVSGPAPGVVGVMPHHVFVVQSVVGPGRVIATSGNDGHEVRTRERSTSGVVAWRAP